MPDDKGTIIITGRAFDTIDIVSYSKSQHYKLLSSQDGVSLERINYDVPASDLSNWHSAAQDAGFATPGYVNSQFHEIGDIESQISLSSEVFSPDNDGYDDQLVITYNLDVAGYSGTIAVYSTNGRLVQTLVNNHSLGSVGNIVWDGFDAQNRTRRQEDCGEACSFNKFARGLDAKTSGNHIDVASFAFRAVVRKFLFDK